MNNLEFINLCLIAIYVIVFSILTYGFSLKKEPKKAKKLAPLTVIIPFRNEEINLINLVQSFINLNYNLNIVEFVFVDDHSTDTSYKLLSTELKKTALLYKIIKQTEFKAGKKEAIEAAVKNSKNEFIVTTDADSISSKNWLQEYSNAFQNGAEFIIGPVINKKPKHFLGKLHNIEAIMLSGIAMGSASFNSPLICSGANLGYKKSLFEDIKPYQNNKSIASGDDAFFLDKILKRKIKAHYLKTKDALIYTHSHNSYKALLSQAIRWNSKNSQLTQKWNFYLSILVFVINILVIPNIFFGLIGYSTSVLFLLLKFLIDLILFSSSASFYNQLKLIFYTPFIYFFYPIHLLIIFVSSIFFSTQWKGRTIVKNEEK